MEQITLIPSDKLKPSIVNVRQRVDPERVRALAEDIAVRGLLHPLVVRREDDYYGVVSGRMRLEAIKLLQREKPEVFAKLFANGVPCQVRELSDQEALELSLAENLRQNTLTPEEVGLGLARLHELGLSEEEISLRLMLALDQVRRALRLYRKVQHIQERVHGSRPGRPPSSERRRGVSRTGIAVVASVLDRLSARGEIKPQERDALLDYVARRAGELGLSTSELEIVAKRVLANPSLAEPSRLERVMREVARLEMVERVVALRRDLVERVEDYARSRSVTFDEAVNELLEEGLAKRAKIGS
ncbi:MAG: ParB/RepB/Spo0J family partition protein [Desulfurococcaceae archaeon]